MPAVSVDFTRDERSDEELVAAANAGERTAFEALYARHREWAASVAMRFTRSRDDALDVVQDVFIYFFGKFPGFELRARMRTFLYPAVRSTSLNLLRKRRRETPLENGAAEALADGESSRDETSERRGVAEIIRGLPAEQREIVTLRYVDGMKLSEIARAMEVPLGTVKSSLHRALEVLRGRTPRP